MNGLRVGLVLSALFAVPAYAAEPAKDARPGDRMLADYFRGETAKLADACLADIDSLADWQAKRPVLKRQLAEMLGLDPLPERTPLNPVVTGSFEDGGIVVERLHFQSRPGLYVTGDLYRPKEQAGPLPAVLYVCGHGQVKKGGVSFGNKTAYHHHGAWFARNGYVCLTIDTIQLGEIEGTHHGTHRLGLWWWNARGYTPAGVEAWNGIRAIDYLQSRPEVDGDRIGVTGRSGGGAYSWYVAALDDRVKAAVPVAGITDLRNHVVDGCVEGHCDCMYLVNTYRWDYPTLAALVAPRPLLISNTDKDPIFPLDGVVRTHALVRKVYALHGAEKNLGLQITEGPHKDTQELRLHAFVWFDRFLKGENRPIADPAEKLYEPDRLKVFDALPADEVVTRIDETFVPAAAAPPVPASAEDWTGTRDRLLADLRAKSFGGWPANDAPLDVRPGPTWSRGDATVRTYDFTSQEPFRLRLYVVGPTQSGAPTAVRVRVLGEGEWPAFADALGLAERGEPRDAGGRPANGDGSFTVLGEKPKPDRPVAFVLPRGVGPTAWTPDEKEGTHVRRRFMLLGQTLDAMRVYDVRRAVQAIRSVEPVGNAPSAIAGTGDAAVIALYASLFEPDVREVELTDPPATHRDGPDFLNVLRVLDLPAAVAVAAERSTVILRTGEPDAWAYSREVAEAIGRKDRLTVAPAEPRSDR